jgi:uncharacterized protein (TIGR02687 family)
MTDTQLSSALQRIYDEEKHRIVFWYDGEREFEEGVAELCLYGVNVIRLDQIGALELKIMLELEDTEGKYLIYAPYAEPALGKDWLLDIRLYSRSFHADRASMIINDLGLNQALRPHVDRNQAFFRNQDRVSRIKKWVQPKDAEADLDLKMIAVLAKAEQPDVFNVLVRLFAELAQEARQDMLIPLPKTWDEIEKFGVSEAFWSIVARTFGYAEPTPSLSDLLIRLLVTDFSHGLKEDCPQSLRHFLLPHDALGLNASVFLSQWRSNMNYCGVYNVLSGKIAQEMGMDELIADFDEHDLIDVVTFEVIERRIVRCLRDQLLSKNGFSIESVKEIIRQRRDGYWARPLFGVHGTESDYLATYSALEAAGNLLTLREKQGAGLSYPTTKAMYDAYVDELLLFDQIYRRFQEAADQVEMRGWDILKDLRDAIEACYGWFIDQEALCWGSFIEPAPGDGLLHHWSVEGVRNQQDFFSTYVDAALKNASKVYVIISDALRYEAAEELSREINSKYRFKATLESMLGVLPGYTGLGMASLLPHYKTDYKLNANADVMIDGQPTASIEQRAKILSGVQGTAIKAEDLTAMSKEQGRDFVKPWRVIYVYHNQIDMTGDSAVSESKTFTAVRAAIKDISAIVSFIINNLNGSMVIVTADHGFMFQEKAPDTVDKSGLDDKPSGTLKAKKRYLLGLNLGDNPKTWHGDTKVTAGTSGSMEFWIPKGANRFHFAGGARYIHGGAMLQEIVVPVMTVKELTGQAKQKSAIKRAGISLLGTVLKVVNNVQRFDFIQTESVSDRVQPRTVQVSLRDGEVPISNEVILTFDSQSSSMDERKRSAKLTVKAGEYDKKHEYSLVLRDAETKIEYVRIPMKIDLTFKNDF